MKPKYKAGDKVIYHREKHAEELRLSPTVEATVTSVVQTSQGKPLYHIEWQPHGKATVWENQLSDSE